MLYYLIKFKLMKIQNILIPLFVLFMSYIHYVIMQFSDGSCTKAINFELNSLFKGNGEVRTHLCQVTLTRQNFQQTPLDSKKYFSQSNFYRKQTK